MLKHEQRQQPTNELQQQIGMRLPKKSRDRQQQVTTPMKDTMRSIGRIPAETKVRKTLKFLCGAAVVVAAAGTAAVACAAAGFASAAAVAAVGAVVAVLAAYIVAVSVAVGPVVAAAVLAAAEAAFDSASNWGTSVPFSFTGIPLALVAALLVAAVTAADVADVSVADAKTAVGCLAESSRVCASADSCLTPSAAAVVAAVHSVPCAVGATSTGSTPL